MKRGTIRCIIELGLYVVYIAIWLDASDMAYIDIADHKLTCISDDTKLRLLRMSPSDGPWNATPGNFKFPVR